MGQLKQGKIVKERTTGLLARPHKHEAAYGDRLAEELPRVADVRVALRVQGDLYQINLLPTDWLN